MQRNLIFNIFFCAYISQVHHFYFSHLVSIKKQLINAVNKGDKL